MSTANISHWSHYIPSDVYRTYVSRVADTYHLPPHLMLSASRQSVHAEARFVLWEALRLAGYSCMGIARQAGRHHSTIMYALANVRARPALQAAARAIHTPQLVSTGFAALRGYSAGEARTIVSYLRGLSGACELTPAAALAVKMIAGDTGLQRIVQDVLTQTGNGLHFWRIQHHAQRLGYAWAKDNQSLVKAR